MTKSLRDVLPIHPACELFPLMTPAELRELGEDIKGNGLRRPIAITSDGQLLDGRNRLAAMEVAGVDFKIKRTRNGSPEIHIDIVGGDLSFAEVVTSDPVAFVISANIHRRHLTAEQKREHIARLIKATPGKSDRQIAETVKSNRTTVGQIRKVLEKAGDVSIVDTRTDTKGRKQPAKKSNGPKAPDPPLSKAARQLKPAAKGKETFYCLFCDKSQHEVECLITHREDSWVAICDECVAACVKTIAEQKTKQNTPPPPPADDGLGIPDFLDRSKQMEIAS